MEYESLNRAVGFSVLFGVLQHTDQKLQPILNFTCATVNSGDIMKIPRVHSYATSSYSRNFFDSNSVLSISAIVLQIRKQATGISTVISRVAVIVATKAAINLYLSQPKQPNDSGQWR